MFQDHESPFHLSKFEFVAERKRVLGLVNQICIIEKKSVCYVVTHKMCRLFYHFIHSHKGITTQLDTTLTSKIEFEKDRVNKR